MAPVLVSETCRVVRTSNCWPRSSSSFATIWVTEAGVILRLRAPAAKLLSSTTFKTTRTGLIPYMG